MFTIGELDEHVTHDQQTQDDVDGPVVLVNDFHVEPEQGDDLTAPWGDLIRQFKDQPGYLSAQLHRGTAGSGTFLNHSVRESTAHHRAAYDDPDFRSKLPGHPEGTVATPHLLRRVAIAGVCVA